MSYPLMRYGDNLPAVGVLQKLLNRTGAGLTADGAFGPRTKTALQDFPRPRGLGVDGVGQSAWPRVSASANLSIIDCIFHFEGPTVTAIPGGGSLRFSPA